MDIDALLLAFKDSLFLSISLIFGFFALSVSDYPILLDRVLFLRVRGVFFHKVLLFVMIQTTE